MVQDSLQNGSDETSLLTSTHLTAVDDGSATRVEAPSEGDALDSDQFKSSAVPDQFDALAT